MRSSLEGQDSLGVMSADALTNAGYDVTVFDLEPLKVPPRGAKYDCWEYIR